MSSFRVPRADQQKVLLFGIVFALIARTGFIFLGAAAVNAWSWLFYIFGAFLIFTAIKLLRPEEESDDANNFVIRLAKRLFKTTDRYDGDKLVTIENGKKVLTPMLLVMVAIGGTDLLFALDSIPAIFGLTQNPYIVFTATAFSLLGLRQLYFLIDGLLDRLIFLSYGLAAILGFIGVKLVLHALHENTLPFLNGGEHIPVFEISTGLSLIVIIGILTVTVLASLLSPAGRAHTIISDARTQAKKIVDHADAPEDIPDGHHVDEVELETSYTRMVERQKSFANLKPKHQAKAADDEELQRLLARAHELQAKSSDSRGLL